MNPIAVYEFQSHKIELFGEPSKLLWKERTFFDILGRFKEDISGSSLVDTQYCVDAFNAHQYGDEQILIGKFLNWVQHDAVYRLKKTGAYSAMDDTYHEELSGTDTDHGFIYFAGTFRYPSWSWSSLMRALGFTTDCCPKLFDSGEDIDDDTLRQLHFIVAENPTWADDEDIFDTIDHIQKKCALFIKHHVLQGILPLLASQGNLTN
jgi:hypothetical protein